MQPEEIARAADRGLRIRLARAALDRVADPAEWVFLRAVLVDALRPGRDSGLPPPGP